MKKTFLTLALFLCSLSYADYSVTYEGIPEKEILCHFESISQLETFKNRPPPTPYTLKRRAEADLPTLTEILHSYGYYDAKVFLAYSREFPDTCVHITVESGPLYTFGCVSIMEFLDDEQLSLYIPGIDITEGCPARADLVLDSEEQILKLMACRGYPLAKVPQKEVLVDQETKTVSVTYFVESGPLCTFGLVTIEGLKKVKKKFICSRVLWQTGETYDPNKVQQTDLYLQESGLFAIVSIRHASETSEDGSLAMFITVSELKHRHIGAGVSYSTDESGGVMFQWKHDNFTGVGDSINFTAEGSHVTKRATLLYALPDFCSRGCDLLYLAEAKREDAPGFIEREVSFAARIQQKLGTDFSMGYGLRYERLLSTKSDNDENYNLVSAPILTEWNTANRLTNPRLGAHILYQITPYQSFLNQNFFFLSQELSVAMYFPINTLETMILALSGQFGSIMGESRLTIPAPKRFYAGSSTSLRGYKYLTVSPLNGKKPIGGKSMAVFQIEPRILIIDKLYFVTFFEIGNVYASSFPDFDRKMLKSAGTGIRYVTPVGPLRFDIAFPLDKRKGIDKTFQIYASIGQTF